MPVVMPGFPGQTRTFADLYYNRYRDYDANTGRYIQADPIGLAGGANPYLYANANPLRYSDPNGLCPVCYAVGGAALLVGEAISQGVEYLAGVIERGQNGHSQTAAQTQAGLGDALIEGATEAAYDLADEAAIAAATGGAGYAVKRGFDYYRANWAANRLTRLGKGAHGCVELAAESGASNVASAPKLAAQLRLESARSPFTSSGQLTPQAIDDSRMIIPNSQIGNPKVPPGYNKYSTPTYQSPSGDFQTRFYMDPKTGNVLYDPDYKTKFN
jgi:RHS repeat-associated protein